MPWRIPLTLCALAMLAMMPAAVVSGERPPRIVLQVIRLKAGDTRTLELALPDHDFRFFGKSGRDLLSIEVILPWDSKEKPMPQSLLTQDGRCMATKNLAVVWAGDRHGIALQAMKDAGPGTTDLKLTYHAFGGGPYVAGFRVVIEK
jgi:hypothetical protein